MAFDLSSVAAPFRMQPGLRRLEAGATQLTPNTPDMLDAPGTLDAGALREKLAVLRQHAGQALLVQDGFDPLPALQALVRHAVAEHPQAIAADGMQTVTAHHLGWSLRDGMPDGDGPAEIGACLAALPLPWRLPGLLSLAFAEDFAILDAASGCIPWLAVCLPSHWSPQAKLGRHFTEVHAPVADNAALLAAAQPLMALVTGEGRWERAVWTFSASPRRDAHPARVAATPWPLPSNPAELAAATYFRTERQTFIPVPGHAQAVFTIHVEVQPLVDVVRDPAAARRLHAALASMSPAVLAYRRLAEVQAPLLEWLAASAG